MDVGDKFEEDTREAAALGDEFVVDLDGYEGPIDVLLALARKQKVDLSKISILQLAEQYLAFITAARGLRIEIAAEYLVMAAWLAYLKSRLLLPDAEPEGAGAPVPTRLAAAGSEGRSTPPHGVQASEAAGSSAARGEGG